MPLTTAIAPLAIAIPAYRRPALLRRSLQALAPQCERHRVPLHVFDDSCSDVNTAVFREVESCFACLRVTRNAVNLGIDGNIDQCVSAPQARYVWIVGEDDVARDGAVEALLAIIAANAPPYVFVNYQYISNDYATPLHIAVPQARTGRLAASTFFAEHGWATGFLGANVVDRSRWDASDRRFMGTFFNHVGKIFSKLEPTDEIHVQAEPLIYNRAENMDSFTWLKDSFEVIAGFGVVIATLSREHPEWAKPATAALTRYNERIKFDRPKTLLALRALGVYDRSKYRRYLQSHPRRYLYAMISVLPVTWLRWAYRILRGRSTAPSASQPGGQPM